MLGATLVASIVLIAAEGLLLWRLDASYRRMIRGCDRIGSRLEAVQLEVRRARAEINNYDP